MFFNNFIFTFFLFNYLSRWNFFNNLYDICIFFVLFLRRNPVYYFLGDLLPWLHGKLMLPCHCQIFSICPDNHIIDCLVDWCFHTCSAMLFYFLMGIMSNNRESWILKFYVQLIIEICSYRHYWVKFTDHHSFQLWWSIGCIFSQFSS